MSVVALQRGLGNILARRVATRSSGRDPECGGGGEIRTLDFQLMRLACYLCTTPLQVQQVGIEPTAHGLKGRYYTA